MDSVLIDTGIWIALFDSRDPYHDKMEQMIEYLELCQWLIPYPTLYETLNTRLTRKRHVMQRFKIYLKRPNIVLLNDQAYREDALTLCFSSTLKNYRPLSLVDCLIRLMLEDVNVKIDALATFNQIDFADVCRSRQIEIIDG